MAATTVADFTAGSATTDPKAGAERLFRMGSWIRRVCSEVQAETEANALKLYTLADLCYKFKQEADIWRSGPDFTMLLEAMVEITKENGIGNPTKTTTEINTEWTAVYDAAGTYITWATANLPAVTETVPSPTVTVNRAWPNPDLVATVTKTTPITNAVTALRDTFV